MNFYITNPNKEDMDQVKVLYKQNRDTLGIPFNRVFDELLLDKNFLVTKDNNGYVVAFCGFKYKPRKGYFEIEHLCVSPEFRHNHLAIKLLQYHLNFNYVNNFGNSLLLNKPRIDVVAYAVDGKENNSFYDKISTRFKIEPRKTKILRKYYLDIDRILAYGS